MFTGFNVGAFNYPQFGIYPQHFFGQGFYQPVAAANLPGFGLGSNIPSIGPGVNMPGQGVNPTGFGVPNLPQQFVTSQGLNPYVPNLLTNPIYNIGVIPGIVPSPLIPQQSQINPFVFNPYLTGLPTGFGITTVPYGFADGVNLLNLCTGVYPQNIGLGQQLTQPYNLAVNRQPNPFINVPTQEFFGNPLGLTYNVTPSGFGTGVNPPSFNPPNVNLPGMNIPGISAGINQPNISQSQGINQPLTQGPINPINPLFNLPVGLTRNVFGTGVNQPWQFVNPASFGGEPTTFPGLTSGVTSIGTGVNPFVQGINPSLLTPTINPFMGLPHLGLYSPLIQSQGLGFNIPGLTGNFGLPGLAPNLTGYGFNLPGVGIDLIGSLYRTGPTLTPPQGQLQTTPPISTGLLNDDAIVELVYNLIDCDPVCLNADIQVRCETGEVTLSGMVPNKHIKQIVGNIAWSIPSVTDVHNNINVSRQIRTGKTSAEHKATAARTS
ncbi:MAG: BON domain-containing protein [Acidobacteriota bacterium]